MPLLFLTRAQRERRFMEEVHPQLDFVFNMALRLSGNRYDAEDLTQETFVIAFEKLSQLKKADRCRFWLLAILRNLYLRSLEKKRPDLLDVDGDDEYLSIIESLSEDEDPEKFLLEKTASQEVQRILHSLPERYKTPIILHYTEEWSYKDISKGLDLPMGTVMSRLSRGRELMKRKLLKDRKPAARGNLITPAFDRASEKG